MIFDLKKCILYERAFYIHNPSTGTGLPGQGCKSTLTQTSQATQQKHTDGFTYTRTSDMIHVFVC